MLSVMKKTVTISYLILPIVLLIWSCEKEEPHYLPYFLENYPKLLDSLNFYCPDEDSENAIIINVLNEQNCYYDKVEDRAITFAIFHSLSTPSPTINTGQIVDSKKHLGIATYRNKYIYSDNNIKIFFPIVNKEYNDEIYLDSILSINRFRIRSNNGDGNGVLIYLHVKADSAGNVFRISSEFGPQNDSYFKINFANKKIVGGRTCYELDCDFECNLYHWPQYGKKGLFSRLSNGSIKGTYCLY